MFFFFFFKQKTAYEMRISDWSSDVCSSDLDGEFVGAFGGEIARNDARAAKDRLVDDGGRDHLAVEDDREWLAGVFLRRPREAAAAGAVEAEIDRGRAILLLADAGVDQLVAPHPRPALHRATAQPARDI